MTDLVRSLRATLICVALAAMGSVAHSQVPAASAEDMEAVNASLQKLANRLGDGIPTGVGVTVAQVEPYWMGGFMPFIDVGQGVFAGKVATNRSSLPPGISPHAQTVGSIFYGLNGGIAPGIPAVACFEANDFLDHVVQWNEPTPPSLDPDGIRIFNSSWVYDGTADIAVRALRRIDDQIDRFGVFHVSALQNSRYSNIPTLLASSYNGISVGRSDGSSSLGPAFFEGRGRAKPDIVVNSYATSYAAPQVSGAIALLLEQAGADPVAASPQVIKAILQAAARKQSDWHKGDATLDDDALHPLDWRFGAGELRIDRDFDLMSAGRALPGPLVAQRGWAAGAISDGDVHTYRLFVSVAHAELTAALCWHRHRAADATADEVAPLKTLTLDLWRIPREARSAPAFIQLSASPIDNVQHIFASDLAPGTYSLRVMRDSEGEPLAESYGLAWWVDGDEILGDMDGDGQVTGFDMDPMLLAMFDVNSYRARHPGIDPVARGDMNRDGMLNFFDIDLFVALLIGN